eukprot:gene18210-19579_t
MRPTRSQGSGHHHVHPTEHPTGEDALRRVLRALGLGHCVAPITHFGLVTWGDLTLVEAPDELPSALPEPARKAIVDYVAAHRTQRKAIVDYRHRGKLEYTLSAQKPDGLPSVGHSDATH